MRWMKGEVIQLLTGCLTTAPDEQANQRKPLEPGPEMVLGEWELGMRLEEGERYK